MIWLDVARCYFARPRRAQADLLCPPDLSDVGPFEALDFSVEPPGQRIDVDSMR